MTNIQSHRMKSSRLLNEHSVKWGIFPSNQISFLYFLKYSLCNIQLKKPSKNHHLNFFDFKQLHLMKSVMGVINNLPWFIADVHVLVICFILAWITISCIYLLDLVSTENDTQISLIFFVFAHINPLNTNWNFTQSILIRAEHNWANIMRMKNRRCTRICQYLCLIQMRWSKIKTVTIPLYRNTVQTFSDRIQWNYSVALV